MSRGILITAYANLKDNYKNITQKDVDNILLESYRDEYFIKVLEDGTPTQTRFVRGSNFTHVSAKLDSKNKRIIMMGAIDNLIKGAAGAAVQNLNIRFNFNEQTALTNIALFP